MRLTVHRPDHCGSAGSLCTATCRGQPAARWPAVWPAVANLPPLLVPLLGPSLGPPLVPLLFPPPVPSSCRGSDEDQAFVQNLAIFLTAFFRAHLRWVLHFSCCSQCTSGWRMICECLAPHSRRLRTPLVGSCAGLRIALAACMQPHSCMRECHPPACAPCTALRRLEQCQRYAPPIVLHRRNLLEASEELVLLSACFR